MLILKIKKSKKYILIYILKKTLLKNTSLIQKHTKKN